MLFVCTAWQPECPNIIYLYYLFNYLFTLHYHGKLQLALYIVTRAQVRYLRQWVEEKQVFRVKKLMGRRGAPELELLAVVIVLFAPILHESLTSSNFVTNTI